jgi:TPR repeat protein
VIGYIYEYGYNGICGRDRGVKENYAEALKWYQKAFESDYISGALGMARLYLNFVDRDYEKAFHYLSIARKLHTPEVYRNLGMLYDIGKGVRQDKEKSKADVLKSDCKMR